MSLNKTKGNMYPWVTHTWNPIKGKCPHDCAYCYMKKWGEQPDLHLDEKELKTDLGKGNTIFIGSSTDMWCFEVRFSWIEQILDKCWRYPENIYLFQSKNPSRFQYMGLPHPSCLIGTTIETNRNLEHISKAPAPVERASMMYCGLHKGRGRIISMEPIMDFDLKQILEWFELWIKPEFVSIGADSQGHKLPEPPQEKIKELIVELKKFTEVKVKKNLNRLLKQGGRW